jgi:hypothetical protein
VAWVEEEKRKKNGGNLYDCEEMRGGNSDLKIGHVRLQLECVRTYVSAFDRTHAECICVKCALHWNVKVDVQTHSC